MKKILLILFIGTITMSLTGCLGDSSNNTVNEQEVSSNVLVKDDFTYKVRDNGLEIIHSDRREGEIIIPDEVNNIPVKAIGDFVFFNMGQSIMEDGYITSLTLGKNITTIGDGAFANNKLTSLTISDSISTIGLGAFTNNELTSVTVGDSVTTIENSVFSNNKLMNVIIGDSVTTIGDSAFSNNELTSVIIPNSVTTIGGSAFYNNELTNVIIPNSVKTIGYFAFSNNELTSVTFMGGVIINRVAFSSVNIFYNAQGVEII